MITESTALAACFYKLIVIFILGSYLQSLGFWNGISKLLRFLFVDVWIKILNWFMSLPSGFAKFFGASVQPAGIDASKVDNLFYMDTDNGSVSGAMILHRKNPDGTVSFATVEDVKRFVTSGGEK